MKWPFRQINHFWFRQGGASIMVLTFGTVASLVLGGMIILTSTEYLSANRQAAREQALAIAESGAHYYRWHLAHAPDDFTDGTGGAGPYVHAYKDPQGNVVGYYSLEIVPPSSGYTTTSIFSTGWSVDYPSIRRTVRVRFGIPSLARYSFLHNANVWFGQGLTVHGRALSNGGIRQDGVNDSIIQSARDTYTCGSETGCSPPQMRNGVWGYGGPDTLWEFPVPPVDFDSISVDFAGMRTAAQHDNTYWGSTSSPGYRVVFEDDGEVLIYRVTATNYYRGYDTDTSCTNLYQRITGQSLLRTYSLAEKSIFFFEDTVWVEGVVNGKATVVAAKFPIDTSNEDMWINGNITYESPTMDNKLGLIAQRNIYFAKDLPSNFRIEAAMLAQKGKIIRHNYAVSGCGSYSDAMRNNLTIYGAVISNQKSYWNWGSSPVVSGFSTRDVSYDSNLYLTPPPYFPSSGDYEVISWDEVENQ